MVTNNRQIALDSRQFTLDQWLAERLKDKLVKTSILARKLGYPILLYRKTIEESDQSSEEEVATVSMGFIIVQVVIHGGFISPSFQQQYVFTPHEFALWIMRRSRELVMQCLENIEELSQ